MGYIETNVFPLLGRTVDDPGVSQAASDLGLIDIYDDPPLRRYVKSEKRGIALLFDNGHLVDIQIHVQPSGSYSGCADALPVGIKKGMSQCSENHMNLTSSTAGTLWTMAARASLLLTMPRTWCNI